MSSLLTRNRERSLLHAGRLYRKGRGHVLWLNGVLYFGGSLFLLFNAVDYFLEPRARPTQAELLWIAVSLPVCGLVGYLYGALTWRNLDRLFRKS